MRDEISRLRQLKEQLEEAKKRGNHLLYLFVIWKNRLLTKRWGLDACTVFMAIHSQSQSYKEELGEVGSG